MEKNSSVVLTEDEIKQINNDQIPFRIASTWGFTLAELKGILEAGAYSRTTWTASEPGTEGFSL